MVEDDMACTGHTVSVMLVLLLLLLLLS